MSGYIGGILILSGCFMYGLSYSQRLKNRIIILKRHGKNAFRYE